MVDLNWLDFVIVGTIVLSTIISIVRGFIRESIALAFIVLAIWVSALYFRALAQPLAPYIENEQLRLGVAFVGLLVVTLVIGGIINFVVGRVMSKSGLSGTDRLLGALFGAARGALLIAVLVLLAGLSRAPEEPWWQQSALIGHFEELASWLRTLLPENLAWRLDEAPPAGLLQEALPTELTKSSESGDVPRANDEGQ